MIFRNFSQNSTKDQQIMLKRVSKLKKTNYKFWDAQPVPKISSEDNVDVNTL